MAMFVCNSRGETLQCWHVGEDIKNATLVVESDVYEVQADGDELEEILSQFANLLYHSDSAVQKWYGDTAKFIVGNLES